MHDSDIPEPFGMPSQSQTAKAEAERDFIMSAEPEPPMTFIEGDEDADEEVSLLDVFCLLIRIADALGLGADEDIQ